MLLKLRGSVTTFLKSFFLPESQLSSSQKWVLGLVNLAAVILFWVLSSFLVNDLFGTNIYRKPFFITWVNTSCFVFYLIPYLRYNNYTVADFVAAIKLDYYKSTRAHSKDNGSSQPLQAYGSASTFDGRETLQGDESSNVQSDVGLWETLTLSLKFILLWFTANLVTNASLSYTSVASQTILLSTSSFFTLILGYLYSIEKINRYKVLGIVLSFSGVIIVTKMDVNTNTPPEDQPHYLPLWGNALALMGAIIYGGYTILLKHKITQPHTKEERSLNTHLFFGFVGLFCALFFWPISVFLHFTRIETFEVPLSKLVWGLLSANAFVTFVSDFCWCKAVLFTSPLTVTVGLSLTIPLAMAGDWVFKGFNVHFWYVFGASIVTLGFLVINRDEKSDFVADEDHDIVES